jgi:Na+-driven multidrug efflux pump
MTFEVVSLILIKTENGKTNLLIWVSLAQLINAVYYIGYGIGSYGRALGNHFIGTNEPERFKEALFCCVKYHSLVTYIINIPFFIFAYQIGAMFIEEEEDIKTFANYLRILSFFLPLDSMMPLLNSFMRLLSHNFFTMCLMIFGFAIVITGTSSIMCFLYDSGAFGPVFGLILCNIIVVTFSLFRLYYNQDYYLNSVIQHAIELDKKEKMKAQKMESFENDEIAMKSKISEELVPTDISSHEAE